MSRKSGGEIAVPECSVQERIKLNCDAMRDLLIEKNKRYGNSALAPNQIFFKGDAQSSILIRLDDKLGRVKSSSELRFNDICDIIGYSFLLLVSMGVTSDDIKSLLD